MPCVAKPDKPTSTARCQALMPSDSNMLCRQARDAALSEVEELQHEVAALRAASPIKTLRMSRSDSDSEELPPEQVGW